MHLPSGHESSEQQPSQHPGTFSPVITSDEEPGTLSEEHIKCKSFPSASKEPVPHSAGGGGVGGGAGGGVGGVGGGDAGGELAGSSSLRTREKRAATAQR